MLQKSERVDLQRLERVIETGMRSFIEVGNALMEINARRLYRADYGTFEAYCEHRWRMSRPRAYALIDAARIDGNLSSMEDIPQPQSERQIRPLVKLKNAELQRQAWATVTQGRKPITGARVAAVVKEMLPTPKRRPREHWFWEMVELRRTVRGLLSRDDIPEEYHPILTACLGGLDELYGPMLSAAKEAGEL